MAASPRSEPAFSPVALATVLFDALHLSRHTRFFVAFSGGRDSTALAHALGVLRREQGLDVGALHINHQLHPAADAWAAHVAAQCAAWSLACTVTRVQVVPHAAGLEAAARAARYAALAAPLRAGDALLTAHQRDDQAETVMFRLLRGTGVDGLVGMRTRRPLGAGELIRPLLNFSRAALAEYVSAQGLQWVDDTSNADPRFSRNYLRNEIFPRLLTRWPHASTALARTATHAGEATELANALAEIDISAARATATSSRDVNTALALPPLRPLSPARRANALRYWLRGLGFAAPSAAHLRTLSDWIDTPPMHNAILRWPGTEVRRYRDAVYVMPPLETTAAETRWHWQPPQPLALPTLHCRLSLAPALGSGIAARYAVQAWQVRLRQGGERCRIHARGAKREVKNLFQEAGVPPWQRARTPLIFIDDTLAAIGARWVCAEFAAHADEPGLVPQCEWQ